MTPKAKVTKNELCGILAKKIGVPESRIVVFPVEQLGWDATLIAPPGQAADAARTIKQLANALRPHFELKA